MADSTSLVGAVWGTHYKPYIDRWWDSIQTLKTKPNEIVLATIEGDPSGLFDSIPDWVDVPVLKVIADSTLHNVIWYQACLATSKEWIVMMPIDDQFHPEALDFVEAVVGNLVIDNCEFLQGGSWIPSWNLNETHIRHFAPASIGPFRRNLLPLLEQVPDDAYWNDWIFYLLAVKAQVPVYKTNAYRIIHDLGDDHKTMSGRNSDPAKKAWADGQLAEIRKELEL